MKHCRFKKVRCPFRKNCDCPVIKKRGATSYLQEILNKTAGIEDLVIKDVRKLVKKAIDLL